MYRYSCINVIDVFTFIKRDNDDYQMQLNIKQRQLNSHHEVEGLLF